ncbi:tail fiber domain-containing protein [Endozoicomonas sp. SM1973]|uniref:Tail fiber domain-containing protein n=1 Tax=Spartinivicinus marinus TaxID=2994442 RepID=A0A853I9B3_9GAMM|nr:tail fiber domain-containing protein [Spartinivicinus marinus]MCX4027648.1 tail fiber domain-containing protein [Spartinivicinus marinus]NYZ66654.1 tail fiber domain-containing protein [Spartinivicinus marinus]
MKLSKLLFTSVVVLGPTSSAYAETTQVFCGKLDGSEWHWLQDPNKPLIPVGRAGLSYAPLIVSGAWGSTILPLGEWGSFNVNIFSISEADYLSIKNKCSSGYAVQPANNVFSAWSLFKVNKANGQFFIAPGYVEKNRVLARDYSFGLSDIRLKQDIQPLQESLDKVSRVSGYSYSWRPDSVQGQLAGQTEYGVIAQEVQAEFPELVKQDDQGYLRVDYRGLVPVLLESIKELNTRIEALEARQ